VNSGSIKRTRPLFWIQNVKKAEELRLVAPRSRGLIVVVNLNETISLLLSSLRDKNIRWPPIVSPHTILAARRTDLTTRRFGSQHRIVSAVSGASYQRSVSDGSAREHPLSPAKASGGGQRPTK